MKSGFIFRNLNARNLRLIPNNIFLKTKSLRTEDDAVRFGSGECHLLLKPSETAHRYQQLIKLHRALREKGRIIGKDMTS